MLKLNKILKFCNVELKRVLSILENVLYLIYESYADGELYKRFDCEVFKISGFRGG